MSERLDIQASTENSQDLFISGRSRKVPELRHTAQAQTLDILQHYEY